MQASQIPTAGFPYSRGVAGTPDTWGWDKVYKGDGDITLLDHDMYSCCWVPLTCGINRYIATIGPLYSGNYKVSLLSYDWYQWHEWMGCDPSSDFIGWGNARWVVSATATAKVTNTLLDFIYFMQLYYMDTDPVNPDSVFNGGALEVLTDYKVYCKILTTRRAENVPQQLIGYLYPEDVMDPTQVSFTRWPDGDPEIPCDPDFPLRIYAYESTQAYRPLDLFTNVPPEDWNSITKSLTCMLFGQDNQVENDIGNTVTVMSLMHLDRENDTTICFIPTAADTMRFGFIFDRHALGLNEASDVRFQVKDKDNNLVYEDPVRVPFYDTDPNDFGLPALPQLDSLRISWDGRMNRGSGADHLANPHNDPYTAQVHVMENDEPVVSSNMEGFNAVPWIDTLLITNYPWLPPPPLNNGIDIYSLIRGKIDDTDIPTDDYRFYIPEGAYLSPDISFWDGLNYKYRDLPAQYGQVFYYPDFRDYYHYSIYFWNNSLWGDISYKWY